MYLAIALVLLFAYAGFDLNKTLKERDLALVQPAKGEEGEEKTVEKTEVYESQSGSEEIESSENASSPTKK